MSEVSVMFSGGSDSTLTAALACQKFDRVQLLTYKIPGIRAVARAADSAGRLQERFGPDRVLHWTVDNTDLFRRLYYASYLADLATYGPYMSVLSCAACQLAMHVRTILHDLRHGIHFAWDGQQREREMWPMQMAPVLREVRKFYASYDIRYENPVFDREHTDRELFAMGLASSRAIKIGTLVRSNVSNAWQEFNRRYSQPFCALGYIGNLYLLGYFIPLYGQKANERRAFRYYREKLPWCCEQIDRVRNDRV